MLAILCLASPPKAAAQACPSETINRNRAAVVFIHVTRTRKETGQVQERTGTGFLVSPSGYVLTSRHVVEADPKTEEIDDISGSLASRYAQGSRLEVIDENAHDVALLKFADTSRKYPTIPVQNTTELNVRVGTPLCAIGFPLNQEFLFVSGTMSGGGGERGFWLTDMPSNPGDSGAPVFLASGEAVAIKLGGYDNAQNINLLIPINLARGLLIEVPDLPSKAQEKVAPPPEDASKCGSFLENQGNELAVARLGEKAFAAQNYECVIVYLEQAKRVQTSKVWESNYPYLAGAYLLGRGDREQFERTLQEMLAEMRLRNSYLHFPTPIGIALNNLTDVRQYVDSKAQVYIDEEIFPAVLKIKQSLAK